ncbi:MAG: Zinc phosphodiesterase ELAC protein 2 [Chaenotheca gracillima]|nr:MAG: Zinc phosphodiesterase ELAC protein 2 [Chaenotheca gracillima]
MKLSCLAAVALLGSAFAAPLSDVNLNKRTPAAGSSLHGSAKRGELSEREEMWQGVGGGGGGGGGGGAAAGGASTGAGLAAGAAGQSVGAGIGLAGSDPDAPPPPPPAEGDGGDPPPTADTVAGSSAHAPVK